MGTGAVESVYGYEFQGDNLLLARENVLYTYIEYYRQKFEEEPDLKELLQIALVMSWNLWQMDGFNYAIPYCEKPDEPWQLTIFDYLADIGAEDDFDYSRLGDTKGQELCTIRDWRSKETILFKKTCGRQSKMSEQIYAGTAQYNLIYFFPIDDDAHRGYLKIGEHSFSSPSSYRQLPDNCDELNQNAHNRIRQYTRTALTRYELLHTELARKQIRLSDGTIESSSFSDHDVHEVLDRSGYDVHKFSDTDRDSEWHKVTLKPAVAAIKAVKANRNVLTEAGKAGEMLPADKVAETGALHYNIVRKQLLIE
jgi:hypothetical protein